MKKNDKKVKYSFSHKPNKNVGELLFFEIFIAPFILSVINVLPLSRSVNLLLLALSCIAAFIIPAIYENHLESERKDYEKWKGEVWEHLKSFEHEFNNNCKIIAYDYYKQVFLFINGKSKLNYLDYRSVMQKNANAEKRVSELRNEYQHGITEKIIEKMGEQNINCIPYDLKEDYIKSIRDIADSHKHYIALLSNSIGDNVNYDDPAS